MMKKILPSLAVLFALQPFSSKAEITVLGGLNFSSPVASGSVIATKAAFGLGVLLDKSLVPLFSLESGLLYNAEKYSSTSGGTVTTVQATRLHIPLMVRFTGMPFLSAGAGLYYENGQGDIDTDVSGTTITSTYSGIGLKKEDYGLDFDLRFRMPLTPGVGFVVDGRYQLGLMERATNPSSGSYKSKAIQVLAGVSLGF